MISVAEKIQGEPHRPPNIPVIFNITFDGKDTTQGACKEDRLRKIWVSEFGEAGASGELSKFMHKMSLTLIEENHLKHTPYYYATMQLHREFFIKLLIESPDLSPFDCSVLLVMGHVRMMTNKKYKIDELISDVIQMMEGFDHSQPSANVAVMIAGANKLIAAHPIKRT